MRTLFLFLLPSPAGEGGPLAVDEELVSHCAKLCVSLIRTNTYKEFL